MTLVARHGALTDIGLHRKTNEDTYVVQSPLFAVCDGMGGAQAGEVASGLAAETLAAGVAAGRPILKAAEDANAAVFARANDNLEQTGMGTTLTAFVLEAGTAHFVHIGDSRAYLLRDGALEQVSDDHSLVGEMIRDGRLTEEEAAVHPHRSILSRALGTEATARIDEFAVDLLPGDVLLLCSDGLSGPVPADEIRVALTWDDPQAAAGKLIKEARKRGGPDNITAVVIRVDEAVAAGEPGGDEATTRVIEDEAGAVTAELPLVIPAGAVAAELPPAVPAGAEAGVPPEAGAPADAAQTRPGVTPAPDAAQSPAATPAAAAQASAAEAQAPVAAARPARRSARRLGIVAALLAVLVVAGAGAGIVLSTVFYVGVDDGRLAIYSGLPAEIGPLPLHVVYRRSVRTYESLTPEERAIVDERALRGKSGALDVSDELEMWP